MVSAEKVFYYFEQISRIPRESGDEKAIGDYLVNFARERGLEVIRDEYSNVIIKKPASVPNCACAPVIIQGHTDMVYVRAEDCKRPYEDGIALIYKDGWLMADGTTLGADNGIAVAFALALLDGKDIPHPDLEAVFTVSEEIGCIGAEHLDYSQLKGKYMLNLDTEDEGVFYTSCAGAFRNELKIPIVREEIDGFCPLAVKIAGLKGGHSGMEIGEGRGSAIVLLARILFELGDSVHISSLAAEGKTNAISTNAKAELFVDESKLEQVESIIGRMENDFRRELEDRDDFSIELTHGEKRSAACYDGQSRKNAVNALLLLPCGVIGMSREIQDLVESSANTGYLEQSDSELGIFSLARSSVVSRKEELRAKYAAVADLCGGVSACFSDYPPWQYRADSPLRELAMEAYKELSGREAEKRAIHAGLECGFFDKKLDEVDIISYGPDLSDVHTPKEKANIGSVERVWMLTQNILKRLVK